MTRAFVALLLDEAMRASVGAEIERLRPLSRAVAWVPTANLHLTLKFLGELSDAQIGLVEGALAEAAAVTAPFSLTLHGLGAFPGLDGPASCGWASRTARFRPARRRPASRPRSSAAVFPASARPGIPISPSAGSSTSAPGDGRRPPPAAGPRGGRPPEFGTLAVSHIA